MKKHLAICSIIFTVCAAFASCGDMDGKYDVDNDGIVNSSSSMYESRYDERRDDRKDAGDYVSGVIDGVEDAGEDIIEGAGDAANDVIDGVKGDKTNKHEKEHKGTNTTTSR